MPQQDATPEQDFAAVHADDAFLDALGAAHPSPVPGDDLAELLAAWRDDVDSAPVTCWEPAR